MARQALVVGAALLAVGILPAGVASSPPAEDLFLRQVQPLLKQKCLGCHGDDPKLRGNLDLRTREGLLRGGERGPAVVPGEASRSLLYHAVQYTSDLKMPPKKESRLSDGELAVLKQWIDAGALWPAPKVAQKKEGDWKIDPRDAWAFQPMKDHSVPRLDAWVNTPIDAFILARLRERELQPAPAADRLTLLRRVTYTLTGLPPTPAEVEAFLGDSSPRAFDNVIARLLNSPRYGEHWARHWLDVVRYADTSGYSNDYERPNAWRYRDYVIRSFNEDKPYDRFILEQIAGDELDDKNPDNLIAVGYLRMGPWEQTGMSVAAVTRQMFLDDVTNAVGTTFLALPLNCCRCHDHKFDPLPTRDYYRVQAVFAPTQFDERPVAFLSSENTSGFEAAAGRVKERISINDERLKKIGAEIKKSGLPAKGVQEELRRTYRKRLEYYKLEAKRYEPLAFSVSNAKEVADVHILVGGALQSAGPKVTAGVLSAVPASDDSAAPTARNTIPQTAQGRRLALAKWIASEQNPLTARVMVNRIWQHHFGKGLVQTSNNFGKMGKRPTHPELLDWLARYFIDSGWSVKAMHRLILRSSVYQQSGAHPDMERLRRLDPLNTRLAYFPPRRLTAEELRDSILAASGELSAAAGGPPVFPEINRDVALQPRQIMGALAPIYEPSPKRDQRNRRTIYTVQIRTLANPLLEVFNAASMNVSCERRDESTVTPQVLTLFNSQFTHDMGLAMARRLEKLAVDRAGRIDAAFRLAFGRAPTPRERDLCLTHFDKMLAHHRRTPPVKEETPRRIVRDHIAEFTGERVQIVEDWDPEGYEPNLRPWDVPPDTRALAEVCLVLLNSNEFMFVH